jgi:Fur family ferric uptake transcriptional regulator
MGKQETVFREYLRKNGLRYTPERKIVLKAILSIGGHFDVDALYDWLKQNDKTLSKATVYRTMPLFLEIGFVKESLRSQGRAQYELTFGHEHHDHLICLGCGKIIEFKDDRIEELQELVCKKYEFHTIDHRLAIRGYCKECRKTLQ